jgi:hypothetical protein
VKKILSVGGGAEGEVTMRHVKVSNEECKTLEDLEEVCTGID